MLFEYIFESLVKHSNLDYKLMKRCKHEYDIYYIKYVEYLYINF